NTAGAAVIAIGVDHKATVGADGYAGDIVHVQVFIIAMPVVGVDIDLINHILNHGSLLIGSVEDAVLGTGFGGSVIEPAEHDVKLLQSFGLVVFSYNHI